MERKKIDLFFSTEQWKFLANKSSKYGNMFVKNDVGAIFSFCCPFLLYRFRQNEFLPGDVSVVVGVNYVEQ